MADDGQDAELPRPQVEIGEAAENLVERGHLRTPQREADVIGEGPQSGCVRG
jgi:hypothetical protein